MQPIDLFSFYTYLWLLKQYVYFSNRKFQTMKGRIFMMLAFSALIASCTSPTQEPPQSVPIAPIKVPFVIDTVSSINYTNYDAITDAEILRLLSNEQEQLAMAVVGTQSDDSNGQPEQYNEFARVRSNC